MFSEEILLNNLDTDSRIMICGIGIDDSMEATLNILTYQRMLDKHFYITVRQREDIFNYRGTLNEIDKSFLMISINANPAAAQTLLLTNGFEELRDVELYLNQRNRRIRTHIWVNEFKHTTQVYCSSLTPEHFHLLQSVLPRLLPWFFRTKPLSSKEKDLLESLTEKDSKTYKMLLNSLIKNITKENLRRELGAFFNNNADEQLKDIKRTINELIGRLDDLKTRYNCRLAELAKAEEKKAMLEISLGHSYEDLKEQIMEYLEVSPSVEIFKISIERNEMLVLVKTYLEFFDPEHLKIILSNPKSKVNLCLDSEQIEVLKAIFIEQRFKIPVQAAYELYSNGGVNAVPGGYMAYDKDILINPHIGIHGCLGQFFQEISNAIKSNNYIMAIEECIASAKSINISESATFDYIVEYAKDNQLPVEDNTGKRYTFNEACELLGKEKTNEQANESIG